MKLQRYLAALLGFAPGAFATIPTVGPDYVRPET
jgi:hypothetical protein